MPPQIETIAKPGETGTVRAGLANGTLAIVSRASAQVSVLGVTILAARTLTVADFGIFAIASAIILLSRSLFYVGPYEFLLRAPVAAERRGACLLATAIIAVTLAVALVPLSYLSGVVFDDASVGTVLRALIPSLFLSMMASWWEALMLRRQQMIRYYLFTMTGELCGAAAAVVGLVAGFGMFALVLQVYARLLTLALLYLTIADNRVIDRTSFAEARSIVTWSRPRYGSAILTFFSGYGVDIIIGALLSPAATGLYRAASRIVVTVTDLFSQPLQKLIQAAVSGRVSHGKGVGGGWLVMLSGIGAICWAALAGLAMLASFVVPGLLGEQWTAAAPIVSIMCATRAFALLDVSAVSVLVAADRNKLALRVQMVSAAAIAIAALVSAPYGIEAVAVATGVVMTIASAVYFALAVRVSGLPVPTAALAFLRSAFPALGVIAGIAAVWLLPSAGMTPLLRSLAAMTAGALGGMIGLFAVRKSLIEALSRFGRVRN